MSLSVVAGPIIAAALGGVLSVLALDLMRGRPGRKFKDAVILEYGAAPRFFALAGLCLPILSLMAASRAGTLLLTTVFCTLALVTAYFTVMAVYQSFFVRMAFDKTGVYFRSPLRGARIIEWAAVERLAYSDIAQMHYIKVANGELFWMSRCMNGFDEFEARLNQIQANASSSDQL